MNFDKARLLFDAHVRLTEFVKHPFLRPREAITGSRPDVDLLFGTFPEAVLEAGSILGTRADFETDVDGLCMLGLTLQILEESPEWEEILSTLGLRKEANNG